MKLVIGISEERITVVITASQMFMKVIPWLHFR